MVRKNHIFADVTEPITLPIYFCMYLDLKGEMKKKKLKVTHNPFVKIKTMNARIITIFWKNMLE